MAGVVIAMLAVAFFAPGIFAGEVPSYRDFVNVFLPYKLYAAHALAEHGFPLWAPEAALGAPFHASYQAGLLYPPAAVVFLFPNAFGIGIYLALHAWLAGFGMERMLARRGLARAPRLLGGIVYALGGTFVSALPWGHGVVAAWMPLAIVAAEDAIRAPSAARFLRLVAVLALELLGGAAESFAQSAALVFAQAIVARGALPVARRLAVAGLGMALALSIAAAQLLPTAEALRESERGGGMASDVVGLFSFEPVSFLTFLAPHRIDGGVVAPIPEREFPLFWSVYVGLAPLALAGLGLLSGSGRRFAVALVLAFALALGSHAPIFPLLYQAAPGLVGLFRYPEKFLLTAHLALAALAGIGLGRLQSFLAGQMRLPVAAVSLALCALTAADLWDVHRPAMLFTDFDALLASAPPKEIGVIGAGTRLFHYQRAGAALKPWNPKFVIGENLEDFERRVWADLGANVGLVYGAGLVADAAGLRHRAIAELYRFVGREPPERALHVLRALGVRFLLGPDAIDSEALELLRQGSAGRTWIYRLRSAGPRLYLASRVRSVGTREAAFDRLAAADFAPGEDATVEGDCPPIPACRRGSVAERRDRSVRVVEDSAQRLVLDVSTGESALLVVGDSFFPGWHARVDGSPSPILLANGLVRGVVVPGGRHVVSLGYHPRSFHVGLVVSGIGMLGAVLLAGFAARGQTAASDDPSNPSEGRWW